MATAMANLLRNGGFEESICNSPQAFCIGADIPGWTNPTLEKSELTAKGTGLIKFGNQAVDLQGKSAYTLQQTVQLDAGKTYLLSFWIASNHLCLNSAVKTGKFSLTGESLLVPETKLTSSETWTQQNFTFVSKLSQESTLSFTDTSPANNGCGLMIDEIWLVETGSSPQPDPRPASSSASSSISSSSISSSESASSTESVQPSAQTTHTPNTGARLVSSNPSRSNSSITAAPLDSPIIELTTGVTVPGQVQNGAQSPTVDSQESLIAPANNQTLVALGTSLFIFAALAVVFGLVYFKRRNKEDKLKFPSFISWASQVEDQV